MRRILSTFYARLSLLFLALVLALGCGCLLIAFSAAGHLFDEVEQLLNRDYAQQIATELQPLLGEGLAADRVRSAIHYMMVLNPMVEIYILDGGGRILAYFAGPGETLLTDHVALAPIQDFLDHGEGKLILGPDPRSAGSAKPFSAAAIRLGNASGFVYVILSGQGFEHSMQMIRQSYYLRAGLVAFLLAVGVTLVAGFSLFFLLTRRLAALSSTVREFRDGGLDRRAPARGRDEVGVLARSFNEMADKIQSDVARLESAERMRRDLIANISHDLRTPIASIRGYLETLLLKDEELGARKRREFLHVSLRSATGLQSLVEELLELAKLDSRQTMPRMESFPPAELVQDVVLKLGPQAAAAQVRLTVHAAPDLPFVEGDIGMIERVLTNLIENALHHTPAGGSVDVSVVPTGAGVELAVADTGRGIEPRDLGRIFERFYRVEGSTGFGLGLAIAKQIVELHGSVLSVESKIDEGARFFFTLRRP